MQDNRTEPVRKERKERQIIRIEQEKLSRYLDKVVRSMVEADRLCNAMRYERNDASQITRTCYHSIKLNTKAG